MDPWVLVPMKSWKKSLLKGTREHREEQNKRSRKGEKLASTKSEAFKEKADAIENGDEEGGKGADSLADASDDQSDDEEISRDERVRLFHAKKATNFAFVRNSGLNMNMNRFAYAKTQRARGEQSNT